MGGTLIPLTLFAFVGAFTPGPNNLTATAAGTAFGFARCIPQILGVTIGFDIMIVLFGLGLGQVLGAYPGLHGGLQIIGALYLLYLAWRLARAGDPEADAPMKRPLTFLEAALFQWLNPKAWTVALGVIAAFTTAGDAIYGELLLIIAIFSVMTVLALSVWCAFGVAIRNFLSSPHQCRIVNFGMAGVVVLSVFMLFI